LNSRFGLEAVLEFYEKWELDIIRTLGYQSLQAMITVAANTVRTPEERTIFSAYLATTSLDATGLSAIQQIVNNNLAAQETANNVQIFNSIRKALTEFDSIRLPTSSIPFSYDITLDARNIQTGERRFDGTVKIDIQILEATYTITLHSRELEVDSIRVIDALSQNVFSGFDLEASKHFIHITTTRPLQIDERLTVEIAYYGNLQLNMAGFYQSSYPFEGTTRYLGTTQFERSSARYAFICYDEPEYKATFKLAIIHDSTYNAISNMPETVADN
jgi:hypothetical protein